MNDNRNNIDSERNKEDLKAWIESHPREYGEIALEMGEADLLETFIMAQSAFIASPEFQKRLEKPRVFDPFGHPGFDPAGKIILTL